MRLEEAGGGGPRRGENWGGLRIEREATGREGKEIQPRGENECLSPPYPPPFPQEARSKRHGEAAYRGTAARLSPETQQEPGARTAGARTAGGSVSSPTSRFQ